jgi:hypothetical protein
MKKNLRQKNGGRKMGEQANPEGILASSPWALGRSPVGIRQFQIFT